MQGVSCKTHLDPRKVAKGSEGNAIGGIDMGTRDVASGQDDYHNGQFGSYSVSQSDRSSCLLILQDC